jgi:hypothetical protein
VLIESRGVRLPVSSLGPILTVAVHLPDTLEYIHSASSNHPETESRVIHDARRDVGTTTYGRNVPGSEFLPL